MPLQLRSGSLTGTRGRSPRRPAPCMWEFAPLAILVGVALTVLLFGRKYVSSPSTHASFRMDDAWRIAIRDLSRMPEDQLTTFGRALNHLPVKVRDDVYSELLQLEEQVSRNREPLKFVRTSIMDAAAMALFASHMLLLPEETRSQLIEQYGESFSEEEMMTVLVSQELKYTVLRTYSQFRFDDVSDRDWFQSYVRVARQLMQARSPESRARWDRADEVSGMSLSEYLTLLERLKQRLLDAPSAAQ
jgi:hypothetical protein